MELQGWYFLHFYLFSYLYAVANLFIAEKILAAEKWDSLSSLFQSININKV